MHFRKQVPMAYHQTGEIATVRVANPLERSHSKGKARPAVLLRRSGARWLVMGLTTREQFANGLPRTPVPCPQVCGLGHGPSYLWGTPTWICVLDVGDHIGNAQPGLMSLLSPYLH